MSFKVRCGNCYKILYKKENPCCHSQKLSYEVVLGAIVEDSSGVADAKIQSIETARELLQLTPSVENEIMALIGNTGEVFLKHKDLPDSFITHFKNLGPVLKFCVAKPISKGANNSCKNPHQPGIENINDKLVSLNSYRDGVNASLKIIKVIDN